MFHSRSEWNTPAAITVPVPYPHRIPPVPLAGRPIRVMQVRRGIAVSPGHWIGPALVMDTEGVRIPTQPVPPARHPSGRGKTGVGRLYHAVAAAAREAAVTQQE